MMILFALRLNPSILNSEQQYMKPTSTFHTSPASMFYSKYLHLFRNQESTNLATSVAPQLPLHHHVTITNYQSLSLFLWTRSAAVTIAVRIRVWAVWLVLVVGIIRRLVGIIRTLVTCWNRHFVRARAR